MKSLCTENSEHGWPGSTFQIRLRDHPSLLQRTGLLSTMITTNGSGVLGSQTLYYPWGTIRYWSGSIPTTFQYTGQRVEGYLGLYYYGARWYDPAAGRFVQADTIVPGGVQGLDRYAYVFNNPLRYTDPSGHDACDEEGNCYNAQGWYRARYAPRLSTTDTWKMMIWGKFGITMEESNGMTWSNTNLSTSYISLDITDKKMNGKLKTIVRGATFTITNGGDQYYGWTTDKNSVYFHVASNSTILPAINFIHETGHLIDFRKANAFSNQIDGDPDWTANGFVDNRILLGKVNEQIQALPNESYSSGEYWADAFANYIIDNINLLKPAGIDMHNFIINALNPYINP